MQMVGIYLSKLTNCAKKLKNATTRAVLKVNPTENKNNFVHFINVQKFNELEFKKLNFILISVLY